MNRKLLITINLSALIILCALFAYILLTLLNSYSLKTADAKFNITHTSMQAKSLFAVTHGSTEEDLTNFRNSLVENAQIKSLVLYEQKGKLIYAYARNPAYLKISTGSDHISRN